MQQSPAGNVPLLGQAQQQTQAVAQQLFLGMFVPLLPHLAVYRVAHGYEVEGGLTETANPDRIATEALRIVQAGMKQLGFHIAEN